jgi:hypothetical protein
MNISEILRALLDKLENIESGTVGDDSQPFDVEPEQSKEKMMPPLQQKTELLKKSVGVDSEYDDSESSCGCEADCMCGSTSHNNFDQELANIKKNAGIMIKYNDDDLLS